MIDELDDAEIEDVLGSATVARLGCTDGERVYVVPTSVAYADGCLYGHSGQGTKISLMRARPEVCVEVEDVRGLGEWRSVIAHGRYEELSDQDADAAMALLVERFRDRMPSRTAAPEGPAAGHGHGNGLEGGGAAPVLYRIRLDSRTGRGESPA